MKRSAAIGMIVLGVISIGVTVGFMLSASPAEPVGRSGLPAAVMEIFTAVVGVSAIVIGVRGMRGSGDSR
jgi:hypothetical protein